MPTTFPVVGRHLRLALSITLLCGAWTTAGAGAAIAPFTSDGCSLFPDRSLISNDDWCACCVAHDLAYWRGGTVEEREAADRQLRDCVAQTTGNERLATLMYAGVRAGGGPYFFTPYRWGYGWPYGRGYKALSPAERSAVSLAAADARATGRAASCPAAAHAPGLAARGAPPLSPP